jgi:SAM-dependent methyltransferase
VYFRELLPDARLCGIDVAESAAAHVRDLGFEATACDASAGIPYGDATFDVVVCGEVLEHVVDTDNLLAEIHRVLAPGGRLILTTPNLAYAVNRLLLLLGVQPFFTETSSSTVLGRGTRLLGQGNSVQGHLRIFTGPALRDILRKTSFETASFQGYRWLSRGLTGRIDAALAIVPDLAAGFVVDARPIAQSR